MNSNEYIKLVFSRNARMADTNITYLEKKIGRDGNRWELSIHIKETLFRQFLEHILGL